MNNKYLLNRVTNASITLESVISEVLAEVRELEADNDKLQDEVDLLNNEISALNKIIIDLKDIIRLSSPSQPD